MARSTNRLKPLGLTKLPVGMHNDGSGLYLQVTKAKKGVNRSWIFRYRTGSKETWMGLGSLNDIDLKQAREKAKDKRQQRLDNKDPLAEKRAQRAATARANAKLVTFDACAEAYIKAHRHSWRSPIHAQQWVNTIRDYVSPIMGSVSVADIDTALVCKVLEPIWTTTTETAQRIRGRIERILDWAKVREYRTGENPARWRGHLENLLPKISRDKRVQHHPALPYQEIPQFLEKLRNNKATTAKALEFIILTACRSGEARFATPAEIKGDVWTVPKERMKTHVEHRVPLTKRSLSLIQLDGKYLFPGGGRGGTMPVIALRWVLRTMGYGYVTVHGFRSAFRDWAAEQTNFAPDIIEAALAHKIENRVEAAYKRTDLLERRRQLMQAWARFCEHGQATPAEVRQLRAGA